MKQAELFHPRVFDDPTWAQGYYKRNARSIAMVGKRLAEKLAASGFTDGRILDAGCGFAGVPIELAKAFPAVKILGIDLGEPLLEIGQQLIKKAGFQDRIILHKGDVQQIEFTDNEFPVVINSFMLHIVEDPIKMLNEIERVSRPDGKILITDLRRGFLAWFIKKFRTSFTLDEALAVIRQSGLRSGIPATGPFWWDYMAGFE